MNRPITTLAAIVSAFALGVSMQRGQVWWAVVNGLGCFFCTACLFVEWSKGTEDGDA